MTAGSTFIGQFIDHDLTFDLTSRLAVVTEPTQSPNERDPRFDIDSVYGGGPRGPGALCARPEGRPGRPTKLRIESGGLFEDVPRRADRSAIIADPRNDENMMISGLQAAFIMFHNHAVDVIKDDDRRLDSEEVFEKARRLTTWHYQWIVVNELLPQFIGQSATNDILRNGRRFYRPSTPFIPVEFQGAAYRFGHTLVRPSYRANLAGENARARQAATPSSVWSSFPMERSEIRGTRSICAAAPGRAGASSVGRRSSISAQPSRTRAARTRRSGPTS